LLAKSVHKRGEMHGTILAHIWHLVKCQSDTPDAKGSRCQLSGSNR
jgi:hypothetical protein